MRWLGSWRDARRIWAEEEARKTPGQAKPPAPAPAPGGGASQSPPGARRPGPGREPVAPAGPAPGPRHGGMVKTIRIWADGRIVIDDHRHARREIQPGNCEDCQDGECALCGVYPVYVPALARYVHRYQRCPAHIRERQP